MTTTHKPGVDLYWIPLGAGGRSVRFNGIIYEAMTAQRTFDLLDSVPTPVWGRDLLNIGDMWSCNSVISWTLATAGAELADIRLPPQGRAPGWDAGVALSEQAERWKAPADTARCSTSVLVK